LGGARSRGLGKVTLALDWEGALLVTRGGLRNYLLERKGTVSLAEEAIRRDYWQKFLGELSGNGGQNDAQATG
jgi:hypothetical protein